MEQSRIWGVVCLLLGCADEKDANRPKADAEPPKLLAQPVTATVKRSATRLVQIETEHETLLTTPEHPFATLRSGWIGAEQLVPGDRVVSARFGTARVLSAHSKALSHPVPVFNLSVNPSHAYLVGMDQVLVHNTSCKEKPPEDDPLTRETRRLEELDRQIEALKAELGSARDKTEIQKSLDELKDERKKVSKTLSRLKVKDKKRRGEHVPLAQRLLERAEAEYESTKKDLEATQRALRELETQAQDSEAERRAARTRKAELERTLQKQRADHEAAERIVIWERRVAEIEHLRKTEGKRPELERERTELKAKVYAERTRTSSRANMRRKLAAPEHKEALREADRLKKRRKHRSAAYVADSKRPRDTLELMREELAALREQPASASRDQEIAELTERVETLENMVQSRRKAENARLALTRAHRERRERSSQGKDTDAIDRKIAGLSRGLEASRTERNTVRARAVLLGIREARRRKAPLGVDEVHSRELERDVAEGGTIDEARLDEFERVIAEALRDDSNTLDAEFFETIWREAEG